jgi:hypothetical protein
MLLPVSYGPLYSTENPLSWTPSVDRLVGLCVVACMRVTVYGFCIGNLFIEHLQIATTSSYSHVANSHTLKFNISRIRTSQHAVFSPVVAWWRTPTTSSTSVLTSLPAGDCPTAPCFSRIWRALTMVYNTQNHWVSALCPSSGILNY